MKKLVTIILSLILALACIPALAFNETGYPICDEVVTITMAMPYNGAQSDFSVFDMIQGVERDLGIRLECYPYNSEAWDTQLTLMLAGDSLPDFIIDVDMSLSELADLGSQGYFMPLNDLLEQYAPNITAMMEKYPAMRMYSTSPDGNMYTVVGLQESTLFTVSRSWINRAWLDNVGMAYPTNVDELKEVLIAFRDQDANGNGDPSDEIPMSSMTSGLKAVMLNAFGLNTSSISNNSGTYLLDEEDGKVFLGETTDNYKAYLKYMNELWNENLLDHDNFIQTDAEFQAKASNAGVGVFASAAPFVAYGKSLDFDQNFCWFGGLSSDCQPERTAYLSSPVVCKPYYMINAESEHAPEIIRMLDYFYTKEGELVAKYGYENDNYDMIALTIPGLEEFSILQIHQPEGYSSTEDYRNNAVTPSEYFGPYLPAAGTYHAPAMAANKEQLEALLPMYGWGILAARDCLSNEAIQKKDIFPVLLYNEAEGNERTSLYTDICLYIETMHAQFITGVVDIDAGWEDFQSKLEEMQLSRLLEIEQAAYNRLVANN